MKIPPRKTSNHSFIGNKKHHENFNVQHSAFDKPFIENATHGKLEIEYTNQL
jgi:hypothetical protein